jgi:hypothetical protein
MDNLKPDALCAHGLSCAVQLKIKFFLLKLRNMNDNELCALDAEQTCNWHESFRFDSVTGLVHEYVGEVTILMA